MAKQPKRPTLIHCKVTETTHPKAPWRVTFDAEQAGKSVRLRKAFADEDAAWRFAEDKDREIGNHGIRYGDVPPEVRRAFDFFRDESASLLEMGAEVPRFEELVSAALAGIRTHHNQLADNQITVAEGVAEFLAYKKTRVGTRQAADLADRTKRFAEDFGDKAFASITTAQIDRWLSSLRSRRPGKLLEAPLLGPLARNHHRAVLNALFSYASAKARLWCPHNPVTDLDPEAVADSEPKAYSPADAALVMQAALDHKPALLPVLALGFFAGLRVSEAQVFDLSKLDRKADEFRVKSIKTGGRIVPFLDSCKAWLFAQPRRKGKAWLTSPRSMVDEMAELFTLAKVEQIDNGARHSFISYRCAETRNTAQVADEVGNSAGTIKKYYREIVTADAAKQFFAIRPATPAANVTHIETGRKLA